ncbi:acyl-CoA synthetase family protein [Algoriphagus hitonicola]|uniref:Acyl-protein synthetase, LuxE n=1 Tax=Algoriphagus hitonicola TaxID=435880 RepID=A0A1I2WUS8_9BACT|nr:acyl transferase [Algoriphagus hitonicola]SFH05055.1 Acyl-protein synthetase, LuxE [Algoriphagus hitonicola]
MNDFKSFSRAVDELKPEDFEKLALEIFQFQALENGIYRSYLNARRIDFKSVKALDQIPFLPIRFFKEHKVISGDTALFPSFFSSSGTTGMITSRHYTWSIDWYLDHAKRIFESEYGPIEDYHILALLPAYLERKGSSLVSMADYFIKVSQSEHSGFYLYDQEELVSKIDGLKGDSRKILLLGVTFALLDLVESGLAFSKTKNLIVMETGGMKGRRKEMIREEVHEILTGYFCVDSIHSEYGMTEMMSQAYSKGQGNYTLPQSMRVMLRDVNDPLSWTRRKQGGINVIDLGNFHSCAFLETQDLGRMDSDGRIEVLGRFDNSEIRGCNLLVQ